MFFKHRIFFAKTKAGRAGNRVSVGSAAFGCALKLQQGPLLAQGGSAKPRTGKCRSPWSTSAYIPNCALGATVSSQTESAQGCVCSTGKEFVRMVSGHTHLGHYCNTIRGQAGVQCREKMS